MKFQSFDQAYIDRLRSGDRATEEHFVGYFTELLHLKLRSRLRSQQAVEDLRQETFARVLFSLRKPDTLRQPEKLGAFVNSVCNNVLLEYYRSSSRSQSLDEEGQTEPVDTHADALSVASSKQLSGKVHEILTKMPARDRTLLKAVFLEERDRDEVCSEFNIDRAYLRVMLFRARQEFKTEYLKHVGAGPTAQKA
ncbi:MAG: sigma-70 family RNA polymerase sigma factor [Acidobacteriota bacterium]|nr:sigma-70 family RNA polymerase sigma factor [Acidobacteriota bacterium]